MKRLFVLPEEGDPYAQELYCALERIRDPAVVSLEELSVNYLEENKIDVLISTEISKAWYYVTRGMGIVTLVFGSRSNCYDKSDIVIDYRGHDPRHYFVGDEHSVCRNPDFDFAEVSQLITKLEWDSKFFGFNVAYLSCMHLTENVYDYVERFALNEDIRLIEYLCNCHDARSVKVAEDKGFRFTDIRMKFIRSLGEEPAQTFHDGIRFGLAEEADIPGLCRIADGLYGDSRYHFDSNFEDKRILDFYKSWVEKGVRGDFDDECWCLYEREGNPIAFCTVRYGKGRVAKIGLVGIGRAHQGLGLGKRLLCGVFNKLWRKNMEKVIVVTQGRNYGAQNLYQSVGFRTKYTQLWYHKWN